MMLRRYQLTRKKGVQNFQMANHRRFWAQAVERVVKRRSQGQVKVRYKRETWKTYRRSGFDLSYRAQGFSVTDANVKKTSQPNTKTQYLHFHYRFIIFIRQKGCVPFCAIPRGPFLPASTQRFLCQNILQHLLFLNPAKAFLLVFLSFLRACLVQCIFNLCSHITHNIPVGEKTQNKYKFHVFTFLFFKGNNR